MIFVCDVCLDIHIITHVSRSEDNFRVSVLSLLIQVGCGIELKLSGCVWAFLDTKPSHWSSSFISSFPSCQEMNRIQCHMLTAMMWGPLTSQKQWSQLTLGWNLQNYEGKFHNLIIMDISLQCEKLINTYNSTFGEVESDAAFYFSFIDVETIYLWNKVSIRISYSLNHLSKLNFDSPMCVRHYITYRRNYSRKKDIAPALGVLTLAA